jgi:hypothetical protein
MDIIENIRIVLICAVAIGCFGYLTFSRKEYERRGFNKESKKAVFFVRGFFGLLTFVWLVALFEFVQ